jgi:hypothetical protein
MTLVHFGVCDLLVTILSATARDIALKPGTSNDLVSCVLQLKERKSTRYDRQDNRKRAEARTQSNGRRENRGGKSAAMQKTYFSQPPQLSELYFIVLARVAVSALETRYVAEI